MEWMYPRKLAQRWGISPRTLERWRYLNQGPHFHMEWPPNQVVYFYKDILFYETWLRRHKPVVGARGAVRIMLNGRRLMPVPKLPD